MRATIDGRVAHGTIAARGHGMGIRGTYVRLFAWQRWHQEEKRAALQLFAAPDAKAKPDEKAKAKTAP